MPAPDFAVVLSLAGLAALIVGLVPILAQASPRYRRVVVRVVAATPMLTFAGGACWAVVTAAPDHLSAALAGTLETVPEADFSGFRFAGVGEDAEPAAGPTLGPALVAVETDGP